MGISEIDRADHMVKSDSDIIDFLSKCGSFELHMLLRAMESRFSTLSKRLVKQYPGETDIPNATTPERIKLSNEMFKLLQWYGSNAIVYGTKKLITRKDGCHYHQILRDVAKVLNYSQKRKDREKLPKVAAVDWWENKICSLLLASTVRNKKPQEIAIMFEEAGLDADAAKDAAKRFSPSGIIGISLPVAVKFLGKKTVTVLIEKIFVHLTHRTIGKQAAIQAAKRLLVKLPQKTFAKIISGIGWVLLTTDAVFFLSSPARRITIPTVSMISALRSLDRLEGLDGK